MNSSEYPWQVCRRLSLNLSISDLNQTDMNDEERRITHLLSNWAGIVKISAVEKAQLNRLRITTGQDLASIYQLTVGLKRATASVRLM